MKSNVSIGLLLGLDYAGVYRFGFNGKEKDNETFGEGNAYDFGARIYDARLGRWMSVDPLSYNYQDLSPYQFVANSPLIFIDPDGKWIDWVFSKGLREFRRELKSTEDGKIVWKDLRNYPGRIVIKVVNEVTVSENNNGDLSLMGGLTITPGNYKEIKHGRNGPYYRKTTIIVSLGTQRLISAVESNTGKSWAEMNGAERNAGMCAELDMAKGYEILKFSQNSKPEKSDVSNFDLWSVRVISPPNPDSPKIPSNESRSEFISRVAAHEGVHGVGDVQIDNHYRGPGPSDEYEVKPNLIEEKVIKGIQNKRGGN